MISVRIEEGGSTLKTALTHLDDTLEPVELQSALEDNAGAFAQLVLIELIGVE